MCTSLALVDLNRCLPGFSVFIDIENMSQFFLKWRLTKTASPFHTSATSSCGRFDLATFLLMASLYWILKRSEPFFEAEIEFWKRNERYRKTDFRGNSCYGAYSERDPNRPKQIVPWTTAGISDWQTVGISNFYFGPSPFPMPKKGCRRVFPEEKVFASTCVDFTNLFGSLLG